MGVPDAFIDAQALEGKVAIITGAATGERASLGSSFALYLASCGARIVAVDIADVCPLVDQINARNGTALGLRADVADPSAVAQVLATTLEAFGQVDILVNNAALGSNGAPKAALDFSVDEWDAHMNVNVRGSFLFAQAAARAMKSRGYGKIINIGSPMIQNGTGKRVAYVTSKAAIHGLTRALARELGAHGIRVNTLTPGYPLTAFTRAEMDKHEGREAALLAQRSIAAHVTPDDIARALAFLASPMSDAITGQHIIIDNGAVFD